MGIPAWRYACFGMPGKYPHVEALAYRYSNTQLDGSARVVLFGIYVTRTPIWVTLSVRSTKDSSTGHLVIRNRKAEGPSWVSHLSEGAFCIHFEKTTLLEFYCQPRPLFLSACFLLYVSGTAILYQAPRRLYVLMFRAPVSRVQ